VATSGQPDGERGVLRERGIGADELADGVSPASIDVLVDLVVEDGGKVIWH
jgi:hypothetical protein